MSADYEQVLEHMENTVHALTKRLPAPQKVPYKDSFVFRHVEKTIHQAMVQKLARTVSTLRATLLLREVGLFQEQAVLHRVLDELQEDAKFLACGVIQSDVTELHQKYLDAFFEEEFDADTSMASTQKRPMIPRQKIRAHLARGLGDTADTSTNLEASRTISKAYSGFVHAASPHIMDMYGGNPPRFFMRGMLGTEREQEFDWDIWNYFYRGILTFAIVAKAFGDDTRFKSISDYAKEFARVAGKDYFPSE